MPYCLYWWYFSIKKYVNTIVYKADPGFKKWPYKKILNLGFSVLYCFSNYYISFNYLWFVVPNWCRISRNIDNRLLSGVYHIIWICCCNSWKSVNDNPKKKRVVSETFVSIVTSTVLSLFAAVISILLTTIKTILIISILSFALLDLSFTIMMLLLMITKRTFVIYCESDWLHIATAEIVLNVADIYLRYFW